MVSKKIIKSYDFDTIEDYFNYIVESKINGQKTQAKELYNSLSRRQKNAFIQFAEGVYFYDAADNDNEEFNQANLLTYLNS
jgi:hypothetical protein